MCLIKNELKKKLETELRKCVIVENKILKENNLVLCHGCRKEIPIKNTGNYCKSCRLSIESDKKVSIAKAKKKWRDRNKAKLKAYRDSRKDITKEYDRLRYERLGKELTYE